ncbi:MAG: polysaccharide biosynthesis C-terminal domain-containing protein, partial [Bacillota bacterium]|nr:polysaccharide biosynthesis C-terminal domain-containing protein [Bacillota bacterium]
IAVNASFFITSVLNLLSIAKFTGLSFELKEYVGKPFFCGILLILFLTFISGAFNSIESETLKLLIYLILSGIFYVSGLFIFRVVTFRQLKRFWPF